MACSVESESLGRRQKHRIAADTAVAGRLIGVRVGRGKSQRWLYLFTTLDRPIQEVVELYGERWKIETDLRSLKRTVRLHHLTAKSEGTLAKELIIAVCAYNLVRAVIWLAARKSRTDPRQLSFAMVLNVVDCAWPKLVGADTQQSARILPGSETSCPVPTAAETASYLPATALAAPARLPFPERRKLSGIGQDWLTHSPTLGRVVRCL